jgi:hypothetical protein
MSDRTTFWETLARIVDEPLSQEGFIKTARGLYVQFLPTHEICVISVQEHSSRSESCLNFGVHFDFLPRAGTSEKPMLNEMDLSSCEVKIRVTPGGESDYWWPMTSPSGQQLGELMLREHGKFFSSLSTDKLSKLTSADLKAGNMGPLSTVTRVRAMLMLARLHECEGRDDLAREFAEVGLELAGMAVGPKKYFREILRRTDR